MNTNYRVLGNERSGSVSCFLVWVCVSKLSIEIRVIRRAVLLCVVWRDWCAGLIYGLATMFFLGSGFFLTVLVVFKC